MKHYRFLAIALILFAALLGGCRTAPIQNIEMAPIVQSEQHHKDMLQVKNAIIRAANSLGWQVSDVAPGHMIGTLNIRSHQAVVDITYSTEHYSINYKDSTNLKHKGNMIHSNYNGWIKRLSAAITNQLSTIQPVSN